MPRIARIVAPGLPHHVTQRGNNRTAVFFDDKDRQTYLDILSGYAKKYLLNIWVYCLMDNHVHLLVVPETEQSMARGIGMTNLVYTQYLNRKLNQSGRIWQNRFFSCMVENDQYLWTVARYIECNPVKVGLVDRAEEYRWSSAKAHLINVDDQLLSGKSWLEAEERKAYAEFIFDTNEETEDALRSATRKGRPFGSENFIDQMEMKLNRSLRPKKQGRPRNK